MDSCHFAQCTSKLFATTRQLLSVRWSFNFWSNIHVGRKRCKRKVQHHQGQHHFPCQWTWVRGEWIWPLTCALYHVITPPSKLSSASFNSIFQSSMMISIKHNTKFFLRSYPLPNQACHNPSLPTLSTFLRRSHWPDLLTVLDLIKARSRSRWTLSVAAQWLQQIWPKNVVIRLLIMHNLECWKIVPRFFSAKKKDVWRRSEKNVVIWLVIMHNLEH